MKSFLVSTQIVRACNLSFYKKVLFHVSSVALKYVEAMWNRV